MFIRLDRVPACDGRTDGRTDRRNCCRYYSALHCMQCGRAVKIKRDTIKTVSNSNNLLASTVCRSMSIQVECSDLVYCDGRLLSRTCTCCKSTTDESYTSSTFYQHLIPEHAEYDDKLSMNVYTGISVAPYHSLVHEY